MANKAKRKRTFRTVLIAVFILVLAGSALLFEEAYRVKRDLVQYIRENPEESGIAVFTVDSEGKMVEDGKMIMLNSESPLVLASTVKAVVLAAYADAVSTGDLDPNEAVAVADWERYYLPLTDGGSHASGLKRLGIEVDALGFAVDSGAFVALDDIAAVMVELSGNSATDYLINRIGEARLAKAAEAAGMADQPPIRYLLSFVLVMFDHGAQDDPAKRAERIQKAVAAGDTSYPDALVEWYLGDTAWREKQIAYMQTIGAEMGAETAWSNQEAGGKMFPAASAAGFAHMMGKVATDNFITPEASQIMRAKLGSAPGDGLLRALFFSQFGAKDGGLPGVLTVASYAVPKSGGLEGKTRSAVILLNGMPQGLWSRAVTYAGHYLLLIDLVQAKGAFHQLQMAY